MGTYSVNGVYRGSGKVSEVEAYERWIGRPIPYAVDFIGRAPDASLSPWQAIDSPTWWARQWAGSGRSLVLSTAMLPNSRFTLAAGAHGDYDYHWRNYARTLVVEGCANITIRLGWEFNGKFYPWAAGGKEIAFVNYWRRIVTAMRSVSGQQFRFDWCPLAGNSNANVEVAYPGNAYVDSIGLDAYDTSGHTTWVGEQRWQDQLNRRYGLNWHRAFAASHYKPMTYPEWGITLRPADKQGAGDNPYYIAKMVEWITKQNVLYAAYFEYDAKDGAHRLMTGQFPRSRDEFLRRT